MSTGTEHAAERPDGSLVPAHAPGVAGVEVGDEVLLVDEVGDRLHLLNPTAGLLWRCFDARSTVGEISADLAAELGLPEDRVLADTSAVVRDLQARDLLVEPGERVPVGPSAAGAGPRPGADRGDAASRLLVEPPDT
jgi:hypothetical protein